MTMRYLRILFIVLGLVFVFALVYFLHLTNIAKNNPNECVGGLFNSSNVIYINITSVIDSGSVFNASLSVNGVNLSIIIEPITMSLYCGAKHNVVASVVGYNLNINGPGFNRSMTLIPGEQYVIRLNSIYIIIPIESCDGSYFMAIRLK